MAKAPKDFVQKPPALTTDWVLGQIAANIDLRSVPVETLTRGEQWKIWLDSGEKSKMDLILELANAPGKPDPGQRIADAPVPYYEPGPTQLKAHLATEKVILVSGGKRGGKAATISSRVLTTTGWKIVGEIKVGDFVYDVTGTPTKVIALSPIWLNRNCYKVAFDGAIPIEVDEAHEWSVMRDGRLLSNIETWQLQLGDAVSVSSIKTGDDLLLPLAPYTLGAWLGDGDVNARFTTVDSDILDAIRGDHFEVTDRRDGYHYGILGLHKPLRVMGLIRFEYESCVSRGHPKCRSRMHCKSARNNKHIPNLYFRASYEQRLALVQGLMDTDGTISASQGQAWFVNKNKQLALDLHRLLATLGQKSTLMPVVNTQFGRPLTYWRVLFTPIIPVFRLPRKLQRQRHISQSPTSRRIKGITPIAPTSTRCFETESSDGLVLWGDSLIASHQSKWLAANLFPYLFKSYAHVWIVGPNYELAHDEFDYIQMWCKWLDVPLAAPVSKPQQGGYTLETTWHAVLNTMTGKDEDQMEMASLDAVGVTEAGQTERVLLDRLRGRVSQRRGRIFISGSPVESQPWYINALKKFKNGDEHGDWHSFSIPSFDNKAVYPLGEQDPEIQSMKRNLPVAEYARSVLAEPMPPEGLVFKEFNPEIHVVPINVKQVDSDKLAEAIQRAYSPFNENNFLAYPEPILDAGGFKIVGWDVPEYSDVELAIDPGWEHGYAVLACVIFKDNILVIDEVYENHMYGEDVIQECKNRPWWPRVKRGVIDRASKQHHEGMSEFEKWRKDAGLRLLTQLVPIPDGISRYRTFLINPYSGKPRLFIDPKCDHYIHEHSQYKYQFHKEDRPIREAPIDANNHAIKAMTYLVVVRMGWSDKGTLTTTSKRYIERRSMRTRDSDTGWSKELYESSF